MGEIKIPYGDQNLSLKIPDQNLVLVFNPPFPPPIRNLSGEILRALDEPVAGIPFSQQIGRGKNVLLLIDNFARLTPTQRILLPVLRKL